MLKLHIKIKRRVFLNPDTSDQIRITVLDYNPKTNEVTLGFDAPKDVVILRDQFVYQNRAKKEEEEANSNVLSTDSEVADYDKHTVSNNIVENV